MTTQFDETQWPDLTRFRDACLANDTAEMQRIADLNHEWYANENPKGLPMDRLASIFRAQWFAAENDLGGLRLVLAEHPWTVNEPWTAQEWLPITQAAGSHGDRVMVEFLLDSGADPALMVGDPDERGTVPEMARYGGHAELADWLEEVIRRRGG